MFCWVDDGAVGLFVQTAAASADLFGDIFPDIGRDTLCLALTHYPLGHKNKSLDVA